VEQQPKTRYVRRGDGSHIAYQVAGDAALDLLMLPLGLIPLDAAWEEPSLTRFLRRLASFARLIRFDYVGVGLSDAAVGPATLESLRDDALSVLDAVGSERPAVVAMNENGLIALMLAASQPDRVGSLVLVNAFARVFAGDDYPFGADPATFEDTVEGLLHPDAASGQDDYLRVGVPSIATDEAFRDWWERAGNRGAGPGMARAYLGSH
jgi:pimeloyl-ACP methyl ester carboxylesterase